jgi:hypothetical protein
VSHDEFIEGLATVRTAPLDDVHEPGKGDLPSLGRWR